MASEVAVTLTVDNAQVKREINATIREVGLLGKAIDANNQIAVQTWKNAAAAAEQYLNKVNATHDQHLRLAVATRSTEDRIDSMAEKYARAGERGERALSNLMRTGELTGRSMNNLVNAALDLGMAFTPGGAITAGITMVGVAIVQHFMKAQEKIEETNQKFRDSLDQMMLSSGPEDVARRAAIAYGKALREAADQIADENARAYGKSTGFFALKTGGFRGSRVEGEDPKAKSEREGKERAAEEYIRLHAFDEQIKTLSDERKGLLTQVTDAKVELAKLQGSGKNADLAAARDDLREAQRQLAANEAFFRQITTLRNQRIQSYGQGHPGAVIGMSETDADTLIGMDESAAATRGRKAIRGAQRSSRDSIDSRAQSELAHDIANAAREGETALRALNAAMKDHEKNVDELAKTQAQATEDAVRGIGLKDVADAMHIKDEHDRRVREIEETVHDRELRTQMIQAQDELELAQIATLNMRIETENERHREQESKADRDANKAKAQAVKERTRLIEQVEHAGIDALIAGHKDAGLKILRALLEPEVKHLEALAAKHFAMSAADFAVGNVAGGAKEAAAGALYAGGAAAVASIGGGGGGGHGGGGGGSSAAGAQLGARGAGGVGDGLLKIEIVNVTKDQNGREIARTSQLIQRLNDLNYPIRVGALG